MYGAEASAGVSGEVAAALEVSVEADGAYVSDVAGYGADY